MSKQILLTAFKGVTNSSKILLDNIITTKQIDKLLFTNSFDTSTRELVNQCAKINYDCIILTGQKPNTKKLFIETVATCENELLETDFNYEALKNHLLKHAFKFTVSSKAGNYLCNNIYYKALALIKDKDLKTKCIFLHIPKKSNCDLNMLAQIISEYIDCEL